MEDFCDIRQFLVVFNIITIAFEDLREGVTAPFKALLISSEMFHIEKVLQKQSKATHNKTIFQIEKILLSSDQSQLE